MTWVPQIGFNYGQLSVSARSLIGSPQHELGSTLIEEGVVSGDTRLQQRPGTWHVDSVLTDATDAVGIEFNVRGDRPYFFEITDSLVRVWDASNRTMTSQEFVVPYVAADLPRLQYAQNPNTLVIVSGIHVPQLFHKPRNGLWEHREIDSSLIITPAQSKTIRLRTDISPPFDTSFKVFTGPDGDEDAFFEVGDVDSYFRFVDGWLKVESRTSAFEIISDYLDSPPPFAITTTDWVGPFTGEGVLANRVLKAFGPFVPGELMEVEAQELNDNHSQGMDPPTVPTGIEGFFQPYHVGSLIDANAGNEDTIFTPDGTPITQLDGPGSHVWQIYDIRQNGARAAVRVVRVLGGSSSDTPRYFTRGPEFYTPELRDVPNQILQPSGLANDISLFSNAPLFGSSIFVGDVIGLLGGSVRITSTSTGSSNQALATVLDPLDGLWSTDTWGLGINSSTGFPGSVAFHQDSLFLAGVPADPGTVFKSRTGDYEDFRTGANADDGMALTMTSPEGDEVRWMRSMSDMRGEGQGILAVGTDSAEFRIQGSISPTEGPSATPVSFFGSRGVQPVSAGTSLIFVEDSGELLRDLRLHQNVEYPAEDITLHASDQFATSPPVSMAYLRNPYGLLVVVREDGSVTSCSYRPDVSVNAWIPWPGLKARSVSAVKKSNGDDELWFIMERAGALYIEVMASDVFLDAAVTGIPGTGVITGLDHLEGETVAAWSGGSKLGDRVVAAGQISLPSDDESVTVGLSPICRLVPLLNEREDTKGSSYGRPKQIQAVRVQVSSDSAAPQYIDDDMSDAMALIEEETVWYQADASSEHSITSNFEIQSPGGQKFEICGLTIDYEIKDM